MGLALCRVEVRKLEGANPLANKRFSVDRAATSPRANHRRDDYKSRLPRTRVRQHPGTLDTHLAMAASPENTGSPNNVNDLFDYDVGLDEIWQGTTANADASNASKPAGDSSGLGLGLDEEVKVTKQRQPVAKLDESR